MSLYHIALGALYGVLLVLIVSSLAAAALSGMISRGEEREQGNDSHSQPDKRK